MSLLALALGLALGPRLHRWHADARSIVDELAAAFMRLHQCGKLSARAA